MLGKNREHFYDSPCFYGKEIGGTKRVFNWFVYVAAYFLRPLFKLLFRFKVVDVQNLPQKGEAVVYAINHVSYADPAIGWTALYRYGGARFLARSSLFKPFAGGALARAGAIPIDPESADRKALKRAVAALKRGESVAIFPEGTRMNSPEKKYNPHAGVVLIANMGKAKIVPIGCNGTDRIKPPGKFFFRFPRVYFKVGQAIDPKDEKYQKLDKKIRTQAVLDDVMGEVFAMRDSARGGKNVACGVSSVQTQNSAGANNGEHPAGVDANNGEHPAGVDANNGEHPTSQSAVAQPNAAQPSAAQKQALNLQVSVAKNAGACYGVQRALELAKSAAQDAAQEGKTPVHTLGPLIHNPRVVKGLRQSGIEVADTLEQAKSGTLILRSHGTAPELVEKAQAQGFNIVDATCPYVHKVQLQAKKLGSEGYSVLIIGEEGHAEVESIRAWGGKSVCAVCDCASKLPKQLPQKLGVVIQTTQSAARVQEIVDALEGRVEELRVEKTVCAATQQRQEATIALAKNSDVMIIIGGHNSGNTMRLAEVARQVCAHVYHIEQETEIELSWFSPGQKVGISAGASTPQEQIDTLYKYLCTL